METMIYLTFPPLWYLASVNLPHPRCLNILKQFLQPFPVILVFGLVYLPGHPPSVLPHSAHRLPSEDERQPPAGIHGDVRAGLELFRKQETAPRA